MIDPLKVLNKRNSSKEDLRNALAIALGVPCPSFGSEPTDVQRMRAIWSEFYLQKTQMDYQFAVKDHKAMQELARKIANIVNSGSITDTWKAMLQNLPEFYRTTALSLTAINGGFNAIVATIKSKRHEQTVVSTDYATRIAETLKELVIGAMHPTTYRQRLTIRYQCGT